MREGGSGRRKEEEGREGRRRGVTWGSLTEGAGIVTRETVCSGSSGCVGLTAGDCFASGCFTARLLSSCCDEAFACFFRSATLCAATSMLSFASWSVASDDVCVCHVPTSSVSSPPWAACTKTPLAPQTACPLQLVGEMAETRAHRVASACMSWLWVRCIVRL